METLYEKNFEYMKKELEPIYKHYMEELAAPSGKEQKKVELCDTFGNKNIRLNDKNLHSKYDVTMDGKLLTSTLREDDSDTLFVMGVGLGYHAVQLIEDFPEKNKIFYEPNIEVFTEFLKENDLEKFLAKNVMLIIKDTKENLFESLMSLFLRFVIYKITFIGLPTYISEYWEDWQHITREYVDFFSRYSVNILTLRMYKDQWIINYFKNLKHYPYESEIDDYKGAFEGVPAVIVSSGPSLSKNVELLKGIMDKTLILSAGSSVNALQGRGITPHVMLGVDGTQLMSDEYNAVKSDKILFAHIMNVHYDCIEKYKGPKLHIKISSEPHVQYFEKINKIETQMIATGGSCANVAMDFLVKLGFSPIILIGQDLAFTNNVTHAEGVWDREAVSDYNEEKKNRELILTKDMYGKDIYTNRAYASMHRWFEDYIAGSEKAGVKLNIINATEGGLLIRGAKHISFKEAIEQYCIKEYGIQKKLDEIYECSLKKSKKNQGYIKKFLDIMENEFNKLEKLSKSRISKLDKILKRLNNKITTNSQIRTEIDKISMKMEQNEAYKHLIWIPCFELIYNIKNAVEKEAESKKGTIEKLKVLYNGLKMQFEDIEIRLKVIKNCIEETKKEIKGWDGDND